jgi:SAM-dependent methyltransferase
MHKSDTKECNPEMRRIHLGCGRNRLRGWQNCDRGVDIAAALPFQDESVNAIFAEHVIEHITPQEAWGFFCEVRRILSGGGRFRFIVPCVDLIAQRYDEQYADFLRVKIKGHGTREEAMHSIICNWGHRAIWTVGGLRAVLESLGFQTSEGVVGLSQYPDFEGVDGHGRVIGAHANWVESGVVEGQKPNRPPT